MDRVENLITSTKSKNKVNEVKNSDICTADANGANRAGKAEDSNRSKV